MIAGPNFVLHFVFNEIHRLPKQPEGWTYITIEELQEYLGLVELVNYMETFRFTQGSRRTGSLNSVSHSPGKIVIGHTSWNRHVRKMVDVIRVKLPCARSSTHHVGGCA